MTLASGQELKRGRADIARLAEMYDRTALVNYLSEKCVGNPEILESWISGKFVPRKEEWDEILRALYYLKYFKKEQKEFREFVSGKGLERGVNAGTEPEEEDDGDFSEPIPILKPEGEIPKKYNSENRPHF